MGRKGKQNDFEVIVPMDDERTKVLKDNNVLIRLYYLERDYKPGYDHLMKWAYNEFKSIVPGFDTGHMIHVPLMSVIKSLPSDRFDRFISMLGRWENALKFNKNRGTVAEIKTEKEKAEDILSKPGHIFPSDKGYGYIEKEESTVLVPDYISFTIACYALTDVIEELHKSNAKDIIVTKEDDNLVVKYKPSWKE